ncbi:LLM class flavin-dependent oxidoreductase [Streptomyces sp. 351MFTsu5.1]|uniref:LLM class flavin-dependent oxidoreductase n=1 Tax=Streptomyces sp. 351MFTsu5.1 TaxID=1172180 RepID=UPI00036A31FA|nr:LLM class flavin-dependent oxidoreductase [Streptomyces sp. 351MFTsu5.1]
MDQQIRVTAFAMNTPTHLSPGTWRHPDSQGRRYKDLSYWTDLARTLERGLFDGLFIADVLGAYDVYGGAPDAALRGGAQVPVNDPMMLVSAIAHVTEHLGIAVTGSTSYEHPYPFARRMSTLDHLTGGRVAWNVVTSYLDSAARNLGLDRQTGHDERYDIADEYLEVVYKLWEGSWEDDAVRADDVYADPAKIHPIAHEGRWFKVPGIHLCEPSPQRTPFLFQAGTSERGKEFAARHAEAVFATAPEASRLRKQVDDIRARAAAAGREPRDIKVFSGCTVITADTDTEARARYDDYKSWIDSDGMLALFSGWLGFDLSPYRPDDPVHVVPNHAVQSIAESLGQGDWTVRDILEKLGLGHPPVLVGSPRKVADGIQEWIAETGTDGLNLGHVVTPSTYDDFTDLIVPELQRRGVYKTRYEPGTLRQKFLGRGDRLATGHPGRQYRPAATSRETA